MTPIVTIGPIEFHPEQRRKFGQGSLREEWIERYPQLFDKDDSRRARSWKRPVYFFEWLAAIVLYHSTGYYSLITKYQTDPRKRDVLKKMLPPQVLDLLLNRGPAWGKTQGPDLLVYAHDFSGWFFCETKGPGEGPHGRQTEYFDALASASRKAIRFVQFLVLTDVTPNMRLYPTDARKQPQNSRG
jgi:hypothetical protein